MNYLLALAFSIQGFIYLFDCFDALELRGKQGWDDEDASQFLEDLINALLFLAASYLFAVWVGK